MAAKQGQQVRQRVRVVAQAIHGECVLTRDTLTNRTKLSPPRVSRLERGPTALGFDVLLRIAVALGAVAGRL